MTTRDELENFVAENTSGVVARAWANDLAELKRLQNMLNTDSQMFTIECLRAEVAALQIKLDDCQDIAYERNQGEDL